MALTNKGFNGTVEEADFARMFGIGGTDGVDGSGSWAVTQGSGRQTSTAAQNGWAFAKGVISKDTAAITTNLGTPTNGQWYLIVRRINWSTDTVSVVAIAHTTTSTTVPAATAFPGTYPTMSTTPGTEWDQVLAWAWVRSTDTTMVIADLRKLPADTRLAAAEAELAARQIRTYKVADATARGAVTGMTEGDLLDQADTNARYRYDGAAWKNTAPGLVPVIPTAVGGATAVLSSVGIVSATAVTPASPLTVDGGFTTEFDVYVLEIWGVKGVGGGEGKIIFRAGGVDLTAASYGYRLSDAVASGTGTTELNATGVTTGLGAIYVDATGTSSYRMEIRSPALAEDTTVAGDGSIVAGTGFVRRTIGGAYVTTALVDGWKFVPVGTSAGLKARMYGYNKN